MRRVCRRLRPWYVPSRLDSVGAGRCSTIEPVEQAPVPPHAPAGRCPRPRWDHATHEAPVEQDRRLEAGVACVPSNAAGVASLRRVEEAHDCRSCAGPTHKKRLCAAADTIRSLSWSQRISPCTDLRCKRPCVLLRRGVREERIPVSAASPSHGGGGRQRHGGNAQSCRRQEPRLCRSGAGPSRFGLEFADQHLRPRRRVLS